MPSVRLQKIIAEAGLASRREAEEWIREGRVRVNGQIAKLGDRADAASDAVRVDGKRIHPSARPKSYVLLNKPRGYVTTVHDPESRHTVLDLLPPSLSRAVKPVGRLDVQTEGLLILTDDGELAAQVTHPSTGPPKEYRVKVSGVPTEAKLTKVRRGIPLDGRRTRPSEIERISTTARAEEGNTWLKVVLQEGRTRQIRRMFQAIGHPVSKLKRVAIGPIRDATLPTGAWRTLTPGEVERLRRTAPRPRPSPPNR